ncbi:MAG: gamma-glutamyltransferase family protein [Pseudomonadota bacterium]
MAKTQWMGRKGARLTLASLCLALAACDTAPADVPAAEPDSAEQSVDAWPHGAMVAAADPRAVDAGLAVLGAGGHAVDAIIAAHAVLGLVEPQSSGMGGGAFLVVHDRASGETRVYDGRETAPADADEGLFLDETGAVRGYIDSWQSGLSVGVPGQVALYKAAHDGHGQAEWADLFAPAIALAEEGFEVSPRLAGLLASERLRGAVVLDEYPSSAAYFYPDGEPLAAGAVRDNAPYAETLSEIALVGPSAFYTGPRAERIVAAVGEAPRPGTMTLDDLADYQVIERSPLCSTQGAHTICSAPPPSSGGVTQGMILGLYQRLVEARQPNSDDGRMQAWVDAQRLAYADRDHYLADPDFVPVPAADLLNRRYLDDRAQMVPANGATPQPGDPGAVLGRDPIIQLWGRDTTDETPGTTHLSVIDDNGNVASMTATVESPFGNSRMVDGFLLNNELTDFARDPVMNGLPVANAPAGGKRPRSSMSPTIVFDADGDVVMVTGSPGGNSIVAYVSKTLVGVLEWGLTAQEAVALPNVIARGQKVRVEVGVDGGQQWADHLSAAGYDVAESQGENSGLHVIVVRPDGLEGGADPRREGVAKALRPVAEVPPSEAAAPGE